MIPTIIEVMQRYEAIARAEQMKCGSPCESTVKNTLKGTRHLCRAAGIELDSPISAFTRQKIDEAVICFIARGNSRVSAWSFVCQLRALFARWTMPYYRDAGWDVAPPELPTFRVGPARYVRPGREVLAKVKRWYSHLGGEMWFAATMMLEFAMRNGDVLHLNDNSFIERDGHVYLNYTPHKTALTSARRVLWPVHSAIWARFGDIGGFDGIDLCNETFAEMNRQLRRIGFRGPKASYELRKICIDHVYQKFGAEMASSISGDEIRTITKYYADPAQPNIGEVRIIDLI